MNKVKSIVFTGLHQGWAKGNIISQIKYEIATKDELDLLLITWDIPELMDRAKQLYEHYRMEYYKEMEDKNETILRCTKQK